MRAITLVVGTLAFLWVGCSQGDAPPSTPGAEASPGFHVISGDRAFPLDVQNSPQKTQDDIVRAVRQLWDELSPGTSVEFRIEGHSLLDVETERARNASEGSPTGTTTVSGWARITMTSAPYRMFKTRDGASGIEEAREEPTGPELRSGPDIDWAEIEEDLRERAFPTASLEVMLFPDRNP